jgi:hypothetical protein
LKKRGVLSFALQPGIVPGSNLAAHVTPEMWEDAMKIIYEATRGEPIQYTRVVNAAERVWNRKDN